MEIACIFFLCGHPKNLSTYWPPNEESLRREGRGFVGELEGEYDSIEKKGHVGFGEIYKSEGKESREKGIKLWTYSSL